MSCKHCHEQDASHQWCYSDGEHAIYTSDDFCTRCFIFYHMELVPPVKQDIPKKVAQKSIENYF